MSKSTAQQIVVTMDPPTGQTAKIFPAPQTQQVPQMGTSMAGDDQTIEIRP